MHSKEYIEHLEERSNYQVWSIEEWLNNEFTNNPELQKKVAKLSVNDNSAHLNQPVLLPHCMEQTADKLSALNWQSLFSIFSISLKIKNTGCCGMSGLFGHEKENQSLSEKIYQQSWQQIVEEENNILTTGFSCRCQLRNHKQTTKHPIEVLSALLRLK